MNDKLKGHCKHGEFLLYVGCPQCIAEQRASAQEVNPPVSIVKVRYMDKATGEPEGREYSYFTAEPLGLDFHVKAPTQHGFVEAIVTALDVAEAEIATFRDRVKTIPAGSIMVRPAPEIETTEAEEPTHYCPADCRFGVGCRSDIDIPKEVEGDPTLPLCPGYEPKTPQEEEFKGVPFGEGVVATSTEEPAAIPPALVTIQNQVGRPAPELFQLYQEAAGLLQFAKTRVISTNEDLKPATDDLAIIAKCKKGMFERKNEIVGPFKAKLDAINQAFADLMFPVLEADRLSRLQITEYDNKVRAQAAEAKRIEDGKFKLAQDEAALSGTGEHTQELGTAVAPTPVPEHTRTDLGTLGGRANWKARVLDFGALPDEYKLPNEPLLNSFARSTKGTRPIPGVEFYDDRVVTMRTK